MSAQRRRHPARQLLKTIGRRTGKGTLRWAGPLVLGSLARTWRIDLLGEDAIERAAAPGGGHIMALWHGRMLLALAHHAHGDYQVLVSGSEDGDVSERLLQSFGYGVVRGSSSRGGARALRGLMALRARGAALVLTPDGPRGPRHSVNPGVAWLARATGYAVVPCGFVCDRAWRTRSWDRFTIPKPRARVVLVYGEPIRVPRDADEEAQALATDELRAAILRAEARGFEHLGLPADW